MGVLALLVFSGLEVQAQNAVANPFFTTMDLQHWTATDPSYKCIVKTNQGMEYYCLQKYPGTTLNNGAIKQDVHLISGNTYEFSANIASKYCSS
jgi:hypothetical protein